MRVYAIKTFRPQHQKGQTVSAGQALEVSNSYGQELIRTGLAVEDTKMLKEHQNKMLSDFENKGMPLESESPEQRSQGNIGPTDEKSPKLEKMAVKDIAKVIGETPEPHRMPDGAAEASDGAVISGTPANADPAKPAPGKPAPAKK
jgi:hypothetical protein